MPHPSKICARAPPVVRAEWTVTMTSPGRNELRDLALTHLSNLLNTNYGDVPVDQWDAYMADFKARWEVLRHLLYVTKDSPPTAPEQEGSSTDAMIIDDDDDDDDESVTSP